MLFENVGEAITAQLLKYVVSEHQPSTLGFRYFGIVTFNHTFFSHTVFFINALK